MEKWLIGIYGIIFGGNLIVCLVVFVILDVLKEEKLIENLKEMGKYVVD